MRHIYRCPLRWSDMDAFGHVNNAVYLRYLEEARIDMMGRPAAGAPSPAGSAAGPGAAEEPLFSGGTVVARHEIDYVRPLFHRDGPVTVETWAAKVGAASVTLAYEIKNPDAGTVYARASTIVVPFDFVKERPRRLTAAEKAFLEGYSDDSSAAAPGLR